MYLVLLNLSFKDNLFPDIPPQITSKWLNRKPKDLILDINGLCLLKKILCITFDLILKLKIT